MRKIDYILLFVGTFASIVNGASMPLFALLRGNMIDSFVSIDQLVNQTLEMLKVFLHLDWSFYKWMDNDSMLVNNWIMAINRVQKKIFEESFKPINRIV